MALWKDGVATYKIDEKTRIKFYDPYDYMSSMVMNVTYDDSIGWSTANSVTITHEFSKTFSTDTCETVETSSEVEKAVGQDKTVEVGQTVGESLSVEIHKDFSIGAEIGSETGVETSVETTAGVTAVTEVEEFGITVGAEVSAGVTTGVSTSMSSNISASETYTEGTSSGVNNEYSDSVTEGWTTVADRITSSTGSSSSTTKGWSNTETTSISRTFEAAYFNSEGAPLLWTIAYYEVKMPMKAELQYKIGGKWVTVDTDHVLLTTLSGSCRAWQENTNVYYENWANGEPVTDADFWSNFFTEEELKSAYQNKLYPD